MSAPKDYTASTVGRLTVIRRVPVKGQHTKYECKCSCGNTAYVSSARLSGGKTKSCGCLRKDNKQNIRHGMYGTPEYLAWYSMWQRCSNTHGQDYEKYESRRPPQEWRDFSVFFSVVGKRPSPKHSLDRIDNEKPYGPTNVRWSTASQQANNRTSNVKLTFQGKTQTTAQWAKQLSMRADLLYQRMKCGWSIERTLTEPPRKKIRYLGPKWRLANPVDCRKATA